jgi:phospholipase/carboxylesterase
LIRNGWLVTTARLHQAARSFPAIFQKSLADYRHPGSLSTMLECEFIPAQQADSKRLLIFLHGLGDSRAGFRWLPEALNLPWLNYLLVDAPDEYYGGFSWYDFAGDIAPGVERSRRLLFRLLEAQSAQGFPAGETCLGGFSQGCLMSIDVGLRYPHLLAGIVGISGYVCEPEKLIAELSPVARQQRLLLTHGLYDPMIPIAGVREQMRLLTAAGVRLEWHEFAKEHTIAGEPELAVIRNFIRAGYETGMDGAGPL